MANKRDSSKQKRARQNRAEREARKARTEAASTPAEQRRTRATPTPEPVKGAKGKKTSGAPRARPVRPGDVPVDVATLEGNWFTKRMEVPGGRQVVMAAGLSVVASVMLAVQKYPVSDEAKDRTETLFEVVGAAAWPILLFPVVVTAVAAACSLHPKRRRIWFGCAVALGAGCLALMTIYLVHLLSLGFLIYGIQRAAKVEGPSRRGARARPDSGSGSESDASPSDSADAG